MLTPQDYKNAILVQDACNLSGVIHSWSDVMPRIRETLGKGYSTTDVNQHPICVLYADKVSDLTGSQRDMAFHNAYEHCDARSNIPVKEEA